MAEPSLMMTLTAVDGAENGLGIICECKVTRGYPALIGWNSPTRYTWAAGPLGPRGGAPDIIAERCRPRRCKHREPCDYHKSIAERVFREALELHPEVNRA
jgi:hypothetical protein